MGNNDIMRKHISSKNGCKTTSEKNKARMQNDYSEMVPPDGGWGWVVVFGGFMSMALANIPLVGFGILFSPFFANLQVSSTLVAWIFNVQGLTWNIAALFIGPMCEEFGWRKVAITGGLFSFFSMSLSSFAPNAEFLFFSFSFLGGIGSSIGVTSSLLLGSRYFEKRRGLALGIMTLGMCIGAFVSPILANFLIELYGYTGASLLFGAIVLHSCVAGALFQPVKWHMKQEKESENEESQPFDVSYNLEEIKLKAKRLRELQLRKTSEISIYSTGSFGHSVMDVSSISPNDVNTGSETSPLVLRILKSAIKNVKTLRFLQVDIIAIGAACLMLGYVNFQMWISFAVIDAGHSLQRAAWCVSFAQISNTIARICTSLLSDKPLFSIKYTYMFGILFIGIFIIAFTMVQEFLFLVIIVCCWGFSVGVSMVLNPLIMIETMGIDKFPAVFGVSSLSIAVFFVIIGPIVGVIRDATSSYRYALLVIGVLDIIAFGLWTLMPLAEKLDNAKRRKVALAEATQNIS